MKRVILETPFRGDVVLNLRFARACLRDCLLRGEAPFAFHLLYPAVLNDDIQSDRDLGIRAGLEWGRVADATVVYTNLGTTPGMELGIAAAIDAQRPVVIRALPEGWETWPVYPTRWEP